jgi:hypothetical protein
MISVTKEIDLIKFCALLIEDTTQIDTHKNRSIVQRRLFLEINELIVFSAFVERKLMLVGEGFFSPNFVNE